MGKPVHLILEIARQYLFSTENPTGRKTICFAIENASNDNAITDEEADVAAEVVMAALENSGYLRHYAYDKGLVPRGTPNDDPVYIEFRDKWLQQLIDKQRVLEQ